MIRLLIVDDHVIVRLGLEMVFATVPDVEVVGTAADGNLAIEQFQALAPDVVLMDIGMPHLDGIEATRQMLALDPDSRIVILTGYADKPRIERALRAGAVACLFKDADPEDVIQAVRAAHDRGARTPGAPDTGAVPEQPQPPRQDRTPPEGGLGRLDTSRRRVATQLTQLQRRIAVTGRLRAALL
jgi:DNA-binding NarL/FixJ family response regulator